MQPTSLHQINQNRVHNWNILSTKGFAENKEVGFETCFTGFIANNGG